MRISINWNNNIQFLDSYVSIEQSMYFKSITRFAILSSLACCLVSWLEMGPDAASELFGRLLLNTTLYLQFFCFPSLLLCSEYLPSVVLDLVLDRFSDRLDLDSSWQTNDGGGENLNTKLQSSPSDLLKNLLVLEVFCVRNFELYSPFAYE